MNFNVKFKKINNLEQSEKISLQSDEYKDKNELNKILQNITANKLNNEEFYTFSYICLDGEEWNLKTTPDFTKLVNDFLENRDIKKQINLIDISEYIKFAITKHSTTLITNSLDSYNYTKLPYEFETQYLYTLIYTYYLETSLNKFDKQYNKKTEKELMEFINNQYIKEITREEIGSKLYKEWKKEFDIDNKYLKTLEQYEKGYKNQKLKKRKRNTKIIWGIIIICMIINIINIIILINLPK